MSRESVLYGREAEIGSLLGALDAVKAAQTSRCVRIAGLAGIGKTALLSAAADAARSTGWCVVPSSCYLVRAQLPMVALREIVATARLELGARAPRYVEGLPAVSSSGAVEETFYRLLEGLLCDYPVLLVIDDAQWLDVDTEGVLAHALQLFAGRPFAIAIAERGREPKRLARIDAVDVVLEALAPEAASRIVRSEYAEAPDALVEAIVAKAHGHPLTASLLAIGAREDRVQAAAQISSSIRGVVSGRLAAMDAANRKFLQLCALIDEPLERDLLTRLVPPGAAGVDELLAPAIPSYVVVREGGFAFVHAAVAEAVRQSMPVDVPFRKRILQALRVREHPSLEDYERIARQANASGERVAERDALLALAREAMQSRMWLAAAGAFHRAFAIAPPPDREFAGSYTAYATALLASDDPVEARAVLKDALEVASRLKLEGGFGELAATYMAAMWYEEDFEGIPDVFERYIAPAITPSDRLALYSTLAFFRAATMRVAEYREARQRALEQSDDVGTRPWRRRLHQAEALLEARLGNFAAARTAVASIASLVELPAESEFYDFTSMIVDHYEFGMRPVNDYIAQEPHGAGDENQLTYTRYLRGYAAIAAGDLDAATLLVENSLVRRIDRVNIRRILSIAAAVAALRKETPAQIAMIEEGLQALGSPSGESVVPLAAWWAAAIAIDRPQDARPIARAVIERARRPLQPTTLFVPLPVALYAARARDEELLAELTETATFYEPTPWHAAHNDLVRGIALSALNYPEAERVLRKTAKSLAALGAPLFAAIAAHYAGVLEQADFTLLRDAGVTGEPDPLRLTPREAQIAALQSAGLSQVEIARMLVLSERTVESHVERMRVKTSVTGSA